MSIPGQPDSTDQVHAGQAGACPRWCDPQLCRAGAGGSHQSAPVRIPATGGEVCAVEVWMDRPSRSGATLFSVELHYDPEFCAALKVPTEPGRSNAAPSSAWASSSTSELGSIAIMKGHPEKIEMALTRKRARRDSNP